MPTIFISYRRSDSITISGRIYDRMSMAFGETRVFKDVDNIPIGVDFRQVLTREVGRCDVLLLVIGPNWVDVRDEDGNRRLEDPNDFVRIEAETALQRPDILLMPVLVMGASMPKSEDLPQSLHDLSFINAAVVREDPDFNRDIQRLIARIAGAFGEEGPTDKVPTATPPPRGRSAVAPPLEDDYSDLLEDDAPPARRPPRKRKNQARTGDDGQEVKRYGGLTRNQLIWVIIGTVVLMSCFCFFCMLASIQEPYYYFGY